MKSLPKTMRLVLIRHGQSTWNLENRFTGWEDVPLSPQGVQEAIYAGEILKKENLNFTKIHTSYLKRAINTYNHICQELNTYHLPIKKSWRLNERHYGDLTGLDKIETAEKIGEELVKVYRRSYATPPPPMGDTDSRLPHFNEKYKFISKKILPKSESLKCTLLRVLPYFYDEIVGDMLNGEQLLVVAHGNSIRAIVKEIENISDDEITEINIPTGVPLSYTFDSEFNVLEKGYLGDMEEINRRIKEVKAQTEKK